MEISDAVKELRKATDATQQKFADRLGMGLGAIQRWEQGDARPSVSSMVALHSIAVEVDRADLSSVFAFGGQFGRRHNAFELVAGALPEIEETLMQIEMKLTRCLADPSITEYQRGSLTAEALRVTTELRERVKGLVYIASSEDVAALSQPNVGQLRAKPAGPAPVRQVKRKKSKK